MKRLTIFTPTYNRAYILPKLYESLCDQTCQDFEWLVVDDGSTDNTKELIEGWIQEGRINLKYIQQKNGGKMRAYNRAVSISETELFVCIDSDDQLANENVVKDSFAFWDEHKYDNLEKKIAGFVSIRKIVNCASVPKSMRVLQDFSRVPSYGSLNSLCSYGETTIFLLIEVLKKYPYPSFERENFVTDAYIYDRMDMDYLFLFHPYESQICEYRSDGYTMSYRRLLFNNPRGHREYHAQRIRLKKERIIRSVICYISLSLFIRDHTMFSASPHLLLTIILYPLGILKYFYDCYMLNKESNK